MIHPEWLSLKLVPFLHSVMMHFPTYPLRLNVTLPGHLKLIFGCAMYTSSGHDFTERALFGADRFRSLLRAIVSSCSRLPNARDGCLSLQMTHQPGASCLPPAFAAGADPLPAPLTAEKSRPHRMHYHNRKHTRGRCTSTHVSAGHSMQ